MPTFDREIDSTITFAMSNSGELYIDIDIEEHTDNAIKNFAKLITSLGTIQLQLEAAQIASSGLIETIPDKLDLFISEITRRTTDRLEADTSLLDDEDGQDNKPCIKPFSSIVVILPETIDFIGFLEILRKCLKNTLACKGISSKSSENHPKTRLVPRGR